MQRKRERDGRSSSKLVSPRRPPVYARRSDVSRSEFECEARRARRASSVSVASRSRVAAVIFQAPGGRGA